MPLGLGFLKPSITQFNCSLRLPFARTTPRNPSSALYLLSLKTPGLLAWAPSLRGSLDTNGLIIHGQIIHGTLENENHTNIQERNLLHIKKDSASRQSRAAIEVLWFWKKMLTVRSRTVFRLRNGVGGNRIIEEIIENVVDTVHASMTLGIAGTILIRSMKQGLLRC